ncbi:hypothetical protein ACR77J_08115 [Tissierella praeacuta]|uniref:hypothetical protein n=1 Tax=Tissierella praeacuta TaxID=43131 RepID=UPI003DA38BD9
MANVTNYAQLLKELQKVTGKSLKGAGEKTVDVVKDRVDKDVYEAGSPTVYERTYELRESLVADDFKTSGNTAEITIKHDTNQIHSTAPNQHYSVVDGSSSVEGIAYIVHSGKSGKVFGEGYWTQERHYMSNAREEMKDGKYRDFMKEELKKQGYKVE